MFYLFEMPVSGTGIRTKSGAYINKITHTQRRCGSNARSTSRETCGCGHQSYGYGMAATAATATAIRRNEASMTIRFA